MEEGMASQTKKRWKLKFWYGYVAGLLSSIPVILVIVFLLIPNDQSVKDVTEEKKEAIHQTEKAKQQEEKKVESRQTSEGKKDPNPTENDKNANLSQVITFSNVADLIVNETTFTSTVYPTNASEFYNYYEEKNPQNIFLDVVGTIKNLGTQDLDLSWENPLSFKLIYDNAYEYEGYMVIEEGTGQDFDILSMIEPLGTRKFHQLITVPLEVRDSGKPLVLQLKHGNDTYVYTIR